MPIFFETKNIDRQKYTKIIRRAFILNGDDGTNLSGQEAWHREKPYHCVKEITNVG
jgi:hypothetical protein